MLADLVPGNTIEEQFFRRTGFNFYNDLVIGIGLDDFPFQTKKGLSVGYSFLVEWGEITFTDAEIVNPIKEVRLSGPVETICEIKPVTQPEICIRVIFEIGKRYLFDEQRLHCRALSGRTL